MNLLDIRVMAPDTAGKGHRGNDTFQAIAAAQRTYLFADWHGPGLIPLLVDLLPNSSVCTCNAQEERCA